MPPRLGTPVEPPQPSTVIFSRSPGRAPVIAISAYAPEAPPTDAAPFFEYLVKPVHYEQLRSALQRALAARSVV